MSVTLCGERLYYAVIEAIMSGLPMGAMWHLSCHCEIECSALWEKKQLKSEASQTPVSILAPVNI